MLISFHATKGEVSCNGQVLQGGAGAGSLATTGPALAVLLAVILIVMLQSMAKGPLHFKGDSCRRLHARLIQCWSVMLRQTLL